MIKLNEKTQQALAEELIRYYDDHEDEWDDDEDNDTLKYD